MNLINKILKPFQVQVHKTKSLEIEKKTNLETVSRISNYYTYFYESLEYDLNNGICGIVFSKNRGMQLESLLSSYFYYTKNPATLIILFTYGDIKHKLAYEILEKEFKAFPVSFIEETNFSEQLKQIVKRQKGDRIFFMTDDAVFLDFYDLNDCLNFHPLQNVFSLRLGRDLDFCYAYNKKQDIPLFITENVMEKEWNSWIWKDMYNSPDWSYPLSVDGNIFLRKEIETIINYISFKSPNSLESQMQLLKDLFVQRKGICYSKAKYVNVPCNRVQNEFDNVFHNTYSVDELADKFLEGDRIEWKKFKELKAPEVQKIKFDFKSGVNCK
jgi:hypothetical protein